MILDHINFKDLFISFEVKGKERKGGRARKRERNLWIHFPKWPQWTKPGSRRFIWVSDVGAESQAPQHLPTLSQMQLQGAGLEAEQAEIKAVLIWDGNHTG